jgi:hypothetical protein
MRDVIKFSRGNSKIFKGISKAAVSDLDELTNFKTNQEENLMWVKI